MSKTIDKVEQIVAIDILGELFSCENMDDVAIAYRRILDRYDLYEDPFTTFPCTFDEYLSSKEMYERQFKVK